MKEHVLSVLVQNQSGVLRRVCGLFSRRGYNIESLSVGETHDPTISRITIGVLGDDQSVDQITKQLAKLVEVIRVAILSDRDSVYRDLWLIKVSCTPQTRAEILEITNIFRARIIDVAAHSLIIEATGSRDKLDALVRMLEPFGILEMTRTGMTALGRGDLVFEQQEN